MKIIKDYSKFLPKDELVKDYLLEIKSKYNIINDRNTSYNLVLIDDKIYYLNGPFGFKSSLANAIYFDMTDDKQYHEPSLRRAIKDWIDLNS